MDKILGLDEYIQSANPNRGGLGAFNAFFGNTADKFAEGRELDNDGQRKANWKDRLFGHSTEELTEEYMKDKAKALRRSEAVQDLQAAGIDVKVTDSAGALRKQAKDLANLNEAHTYASQFGYNLKDIKNADAVYAEVRNRQNKDKEDEKTAIYERNLTETKRQEGREDRLLAQQRLDNLENQQNLYNLKRDELGFQRAQAMRADQRLAQDRKDKAIAILMSGLGNLGEAFAGMTV